MNDFILFWLDSFGSGQLGFYRFLSVLIQAPNISLNNIFLLILLHSTHFIILDSIYIDCISFCIQVLRISFYCFFSIGFKLSTQFDSICTLPSNFGQAPRILLHPTKFISIFYSTYLLYDLPAFLYQFRLFRSFTIQFEVIKFILFQLDSFNLVHLDLYRFFILPHRNTKYIIRLLFSTEFVRFDKLHSNLKLLNSF